ncbi:hypothetical protein ABBQ38_012396 [Trebouxia sp. C0009 RCD-2024]
MQWRRSTDNLEAGSPDGSTRHRRASHMCRACETPSLLQLCVQAVASNVLLHDEPELVTSCSAETGQQIWLRLQHMIGVSALGQPQILKTFAPFWRPKHLKVWIVEPAAHSNLLSKFKSFGQHLVHLEIACRQVPGQFLTDLTWLQGTPQLQCLSVRIRPRMLPRPLWAYHGDQSTIVHACCGFHKLLHVPQLRTLDLQEDITLGQTAETQLGSCLAQLVHLQAIKFTFVLGDSFLESLTYGRRLAAWALDTGQALTAEQVQWGRTNVSRLELAGCNRVTEAGITHLACLPQLHLLDVRWTGIHQNRLKPLQKQFGLSCLQGGLLAASNSLALAANRNQIPCCCGTTEGYDPLDLWAREGIAMLMNQP